MIPAEIRKGVDEVHLAAERMACGEMGNKEEQEMKTSRREFLGGLASVGGALFATARDDARPAVPAARHDPCLAAFISDMHINGLRKEVPTHCYEEGCLRKTDRKSVV